MNSDTAISNFSIVNIPSGAWKSLHGQVKGQDSGRHAIFTSVDEGTSREGSWERCIPAIVT